jgi:hypothetical protein
MMNTTNKLATFVLTAAAVGVFATAACSTPAPTETPDSGAADTGILTDTGPKPDRFVPEAGPLCGPLAITDAELVKFAKTTKAPVRGACSAAELDALAAVFTTATVLYKDISATLTGTCRSCLATDVKDGEIAAAQKIGMFVFASPAGDGVNVAAGLSNDYGACIRGSATEDCALRFTAFGVCGTEVCKKCTAAGDKAACQTAAYDINDGICQSAPDIAGKCTDAKPAELDACGGKQGEGRNVLIRRRAAAFCGGTLAVDGGAADGGPSDGGADAADGN